MARICINGFESGWGITTEAFDGGVVSGDWSAGPVFLDTSSAVRTTGASQGCARCDSTVSNVIAWIREAPTDPANADTGWKPANGTSVFARRYFKFRDLPASTVAIMQVSDGGGILCSARLTSAGKLELWVDGGNGLQT
ncbi:MAG TPA: hypothetical protein VFV92_09810, partial [Candidatus Bathyarchaeia archaeon]|nr:hypothetical protein [Candidatus Bathyarchaeia archaeon]